MTNSRTTKKALLSSALALTLCVAMLIATTFAWFTDTASTSVNKIESGTLKVGLQMSTDGTNWTDAEGTTLSFQKVATAPEGEEVLWEPGCTYELPQLRVVNNGNLAFKYKIAITGATGDTELLDVIKFTTKYDGEEIEDLDSWEGKLLPEGKTGTSPEETQYSSSIVISGHMDKSASNEYQGKTLEGISITVYATQYTYEYDSYDNQYDLSSVNVFDDYVSVTQKVNSGGETVITDKETNATITATVPEESLEAGITELALIKKPTDNPSSVKVETGESALTTDVKIINTTTNQTVTAQGETYFTISIQLGTVDLTEFYHKGEKLSVVTNASAFTAAGQYYYNSETGVVTFTTKDFSTFTAVFKFAGGNGTEDHPYLIADKGHFQAIDNEYESKKFEYYKVANGVNTLDLSDVGKIALYGEFDGNGATITTDQCLFNTVGIGNATQNTSVVENMTVVADHSVSAVVRTVGSNELTFRNVKVSGVFEIDYNCGAFVHYGTCNFDDVGWSYVLNFENCSCDAKIMACSSSEAAILVGHAYQGGGNILEIKMDGATASGIDGASLYAKETAVGYKYYVMHSGGTGGSVDVYMDGSEVENAHEQVNATNIAKADPVKNDERYTVTKSQNTKSIKVKVLSQLTAYDENNQQIKDKNGITNTNGTWYITDVDNADTIEVFGEVTSVQIEEGLTTSGYPEYTLGTNGTLTIKTNDTDKYLTGTIRLGTYQYGANNELISCGTLIIAQSKGTPGADGGVTWKVS